MVSFLTRRCVCFSKAKTKDDFLYFLIVSFVAVVGAVNSVNKMEKALDSGKNKGKLRQIFRWKTPSSIHSFHRGVRGKEKR